MANWTHVLRWDEEDKLFKCRSGDCTFSKTWAEVEAVGYKPFRDGVLFVEEASFEPPTLNPVQTVMRCE